MLPNGKDCLLNICHFFFINAPVRIIIGVGIIFVIVGGIITLKTGMAEYMILEIKKR